MDEHAKRKTEHRQGPVQPGRNGFRPIVVGDIRVNQFGADASRPPSQEGSMSLFGHPVEPILSPRAHLNPNLARPAIFQENCMQPAGLKRPAHDRDGPRDSGWRR
jgi:hypothetical protein